MRDFFKKEFLLGLGTGFIISALILSVYGAKTAPTENSNSDANSNSKPSFTSSQNTKESAALMNTSEKKETDTSKPKENPKKNSALSLNTNNSSKPEIKPTKAPIRYVKISVAPGMTSERISTLLEEKGVVKDGQTFYKIITAHHAHSKFRVGNWNLPAGGDMEEILYMMTGQK